MSIIKRIKLNIEGFKFGIKFGKDLTISNPFLSQREVQLRTIVAWCDHLIDTKRGHLIRNRDAYNKLKTGLMMKDAVRKGDQYRMVFN